MLFMKKNYKYNISYAMLIDKISPSKQANK